MQQPVRYYIKSSGAQPTLHKSPVAMSHCAAPERARLVGLGATAVQVEQPKTSGVARIRAAIRRGARHRVETRD